MLSTTSYEASPWIMTHLNFLKSTHEEINYTNWEKKNVKIFVLREDLVHPFINGNKWRKLKYNLEDFRQSGKKAILTFGGAFSNHLVAVAAASKENNFEAVGIVRGEEMQNPYLNFMRQCGMKLHYISRTLYREKQNEDFLDVLSGELKSKGIDFNNDDFFMIPEGGSNPAAVKGTEEIMDDIPDGIDYIAAACGTGATLAGISRKLKHGQKALGISALKAENYFENQISMLGGNMEKIIINYDYHFGGYARTSPELLNFCDDFKLVTGIKLEKIYTGKLFFAINDLINRDYFKKGERVTLIHTGGIFNF